MYVCAFNKSVIGVPYWKFDEIAVSGMSTFVGVHLNPTSNTM